MSSVNPRLCSLESGAWHELERVVERFERAWEEGSRPTLDEFLPAGTTERSALVIELAHAELEYRLRAGEPARAEDYLRKYPDLRADRAAAMDFIAAEYDIRSRQETAVTIAEYLERFPDYGDALRARLEPAPAPTVTLPPAGLTSHAALETSIPDPTDSAKCPSSAPRVRLRQPRDEADPPLRRPIAALPSHAGRCAILGEIAHGGMGAILKGHDSELGRDLAVKILLEKYDRQPDLVRRFLVEAQVNGQLQHPGIVPIYELGMLLDRRPYFTMKLVRGRTLAALLTERPEPSQDLPRFLKIFEQICQTLAYAHARGVIHRDLKPDNVMVGAFGEVQVMDWGLAKVLDTTGMAELADTSAPAGTTPESLAGTVVGTPAYMAPEQARGEIDHLDERCDVFGLGAILCAILTGEPPYSNPSRLLVFRQAQQAELAPAFSRLDACGAEADLLRLAKTCLAAQIEDRPRDAGVVAREMTAYLAGVQERLRSAEIERAAAQAKAEEARAKALAERRAKRLTLGLAAAVLLTVAVAGAAGLWIKKQRDDRAADAARQAAETERQATETEHAVDIALQEAITLRDQARQHLRNPVQWLATLTAAKSALKRAEGLVASGAGSDELHQRIGDVRAELDKDDKDRKLIARIYELYWRPIELRAPEGSDDWQIESAAFGQTEPDLVAAFREYGLDADAISPAEVVERVGQRPIRVEVAAALDYLALLRKNILEFDRTRWERLFELSLAIDPDPWRISLHKAVTRNEFEPLRKLTIGQQMPSLPPGELARIAGFMRRIDLPQTVEFLRKAYRLHPDDIWVASELGNCLLELRPPQRQEAVRLLTASCSLRPHDVVALSNLGTLLKDMGEMDAGVAVLEEAVQLKPNYAIGWNNLAAVYLKKGEWKKGIAAARRAIAIAPALADAHSNLGVGLLRTGATDDAIVALRRAVKARPSFAAAYSNLGAALKTKGELDDAIDQYRRAIKCQPDYTKAYINLAEALLAKKDRDGARAAINDAFRLADNLDDGHKVLAHVLAQVGELDKAEFVLRHVIDQNPNDAAALDSLGQVLNDKGALPLALTAFKLSIRLNSKAPYTHFNLGVALEDSGDFAAAREAFQSGLAVLPKEDSVRGTVLQHIRECDVFMELDRKLPAILNGTMKPINVDELIVLAIMCFQMKKLYALSARFYDDAFKAQPGLQDDENFHHRYHAACAAASAGCGRGNDAFMVDEKSRARWRRQALEWLKAQLEVSAKRLPGAPDRVKPFLQHWQRDPLLAGLREPAALKKLPKTEQEAWNKLWADVEALLTQKRSPS
jgi:serine/threonine-protein kinase